MAKRTDAQVMDEVYQVLATAAQQGRPCPNLRDLGALVKVNYKRAGLAIMALEDAGRIKRLGSGNHTRRVEIVATGAITAQVAHTWHRATKQPVAPRAEDLPQEVRDAKLHLQRRGYVVYRAWVNDGPRDMWVVQGRPDFMSDAALMDFARTRGWQQSERRAA